MLKRIKFCIDWHKILLSNTFQRFFHSTERLDHTVCLQNLKMSSHDTLQHKSWFFNYSLTTDTHTSLKQIHLRNIWQGTDVTKINRLAIKQKAFENATFLYQIVDSWNFQKKLELVAWSFILQIMALPSKLLF